MIEKNKLLSYATYINTYLYLIKFFNIKDVSKIIFTAICLIFCKEIGCSTTKKNDVIGYYFKELKNANVFSYENLISAVFSIDILLKNNIIKLENKKIKLVDSNIMYVQDSKLEKKSVNIFINEIKSLSLKSYLLEVIGCV